MGTPRKNAARGTRFSAGRLNNMELTQLERVVATVGGTQGLQRISGGSETDVYRTGDKHYVLKIKPLVATTLEGACAEIAEMQETAASFAAYLGEDHTIANEFVLSEDDTGVFYAVAIQHFLENALPLAQIDYEMMERGQRTQVEWQLLLLLRQALRCYHETGHMPDLYGTFSRSVAERRHLNSPLMWPWRVWLFLTQRLWSAHNLMLTSEATPRVVLVDYDHVLWRGWWGQLYYAVCYLLFVRDLAWLNGRQPKRVRHQVAQHTPQFVR